MRRSNRTGDEREAQRGEAIKHLPFRGNRGGIRFYSGFASNKDSLLRCFLQRGAAQHPPALRLAGPCAP